MARASSEAKKSTTSAKSVTKKAAAKKTPAKSAAKKSTASKSTTKKAAAKKTAAKKTTAKSTPKKTAAKKTTTAKSTPKNSGARKATVKSTTKKPATKKPAAKKSPFSATFLAAQHKSLTEERKMYERQFYSLRDEAESLVADFESGDVQFDEESGEGDTLNVERERDLALSAQAQRAVDEIDHALTKFDLGTYGICEVSGEPIPKERLEAIPWVRERVEYKIGSLTSR